MGAAVSVLELVARRLVRGILVVWIAISAVFLVTIKIGDPAVATLGPQAQREQLEAFRARHHLSADEPLLDQYVYYVGGLFTGQLESFRDEQPVGAVILTRFPRTLLLAALAIFFELLIGLSVGIFAALRRNTLFDTGVLAAAFLGVSLPSFLSGLLFLHVFAFRLRWFPVGGYGVDAMDHVRHALLPALTLAVIGAASYARIMRSEMTETLAADYVRTARAKGLGTAAVVRHAARNALLPIVTMVGLGMPVLLSSAIVTESIFNWPGMGRLAIEAINALDVPLILGCVLYASVLVQLGNLFADLAVARLDPRVTR